MKHTPGPWTIFNGYIVQANTDGTVPLNAKWIAQIEYFGPDSTKANTYLIAASPVLLDACQAAYDEISAMGGKAPSALINIQHILLAAITKAKASNK